MARRARRRGGVFFVTTLREARSVSSFTSCLSLVSYPHANTSGHFSVASRREFSSHGQPFKRAHFRTSRWPPYAAYAHVPSSHGQPFSRAHFSTSRSRRATAPRGGRARPPHARQLVPRAAVRARPLQHLEVAAICRARARPSCSTGSRSRAPTSASRGGRPPPLSARILVPRAVVLACPLQHIKVAAPRRVLTQVFFTRQATPRVHVLKRAQVSLHHGFPFFRLLHRELRRQNRTLRRRHRGAHPSRNRSQASDICGIGQVGRPENMRDDKIVGKARYRRLLLPRTETGSYARLQLGRAFSERLALQFRSLERRPERPCLLCHQARDFRSHFSARTPSRSPGRADTRRP